MFKPHTRFSPIYAAADELPSGGGGGDSDASRTSAIMAFFDDDEAPAEGGEEGTFGPEGKADKQAPEGKKAEEARKPDAAAADTAEETLEEIEGGAGRADPDSEGEKTFQLPAWAADLPEGIQAELTKLGGNLLEQKDKLKRQRDDAVKTAEVTKSEMEKLRKEAQQGPTLLPDPENPLAHITTKDKLKAHVAEAEKVVTWMDEMLEEMESSGEDSITQGRDTLTREQVRSIRANAMAAIKAEPARQKYLDAHEASVEKAKKRIPAMFQEGTPEHAFARQTLHDNPGLLRLANHYEWLADMHTMSRVRKGDLKLVRVDKAKSAAATTQAPDKKEPPASSAGNSPPPVRQQDTTKPSNDVDTLRARAAKGDEKAKVSLIEGFLAG